MEAQAYSQDAKVPDGVILQKELLWGDYLELLTQSRHVETVRTIAPMSERWPQRRRAS